MRQQSGIKLYLLHIFALNGFAVAQPIMDLLGNSPDFFIARGSQYLDLVVLTAILVFGITLSLALVYKLLSKLSIRSLQLFHLLIVAILVGVAFLPVLKRLNLSEGLTVLATTGIGVLFALGYSKLRGLSLFVSALSPMSLVFAGLFLFGSTATALLQPVESDHQYNPGLSSSDTPIVFIIFDEFALTSLMDAERNIDKTLFPNFHRLSEHGSWYRNATTVATSTALSVPAILTGNYPKKFISQSHRNYPNTLFTLLAESHRMNVFESTTSMCSPDLCSSSIKLTRNTTSRIKLLLADVSAVYLQIIATDSVSARLPVINMTWENYWQLEETASWEKHNYGGRMEQLEFFISSIADSDQPGLNLIHINFPHIPYQYLPSGKRYQGEWKIPGLQFSINQWGNNEWLVIQAYQRFLLQVASADLLIGKLLDHLRSVGIYDESIILVAADHGVSFYPNSHRRGVPPQINLDRDIIPVPLFIKYPYQRNGGISDDNVETIDILPTILDALSIETDLEIDGRSLIGEEPLRAEKLSYYGYKDFLQHKTDTSGEEKYRTLEWKLQNFQASAGEYGLFNIGTHSGLIKSNIDNLQTDEDGQLEIILDMPELYADVDLKSGFIPSQVTGTVESVNPGMNPNLAVVVNGTVQAVTEIYIDEDDSIGFSAMVPESSFKNGSNSVSVYQIVAGSDGRTVLISTEIQNEQGPEFPGSTEWIFTDGKIFQGNKEVPLDEDKLKGVLEFAQTNQGTIEFLGWALDLDGKEIVDNIIIFENGRHVYSGITSVPRGEGETYGIPDAFLVGFQFVIPENLFNTPGNSNIRLFAISKHGYAAELKYFEGYDWLD